MRKICQSCNFATLYKNILVIIKKLVKSYDLVDIKHPVNKQIKGKTMKIDFIYFKFKIKNNFKIFNTIY